MDCSVRRPCANRRRRIARKMPVASREFRMTGTSTQDAGLRRWRVRKKKRRRSTGRHVEIARGCRLVGKKNLRAREFAGEKLKSDAPTGLKVIGSHWSSAESAAQGSVAIDGATRALKGDKGDKGKGRRAQEQELGANGS